MMTDSMKTGLLVVGAFALVFVVVPLVLIFADGVTEVVENWLRKRERKIKRELAARWLAELGLTAVAMSEPCEALREVRTVSVDELMRIINNI